MEVLLTGAAGVVGTALLGGVPDAVRVHATLRSTPLAAAGADRAVVEAVELTDAAAVTRLVERVRPDVVVHAAASMRSRSDVVEATRAVAGATAAVGAALVHLSTDTVFDGEHAPYDESSVPDPVNDYGRWKLEAERIATDAVPDAAITRTSLVVSSHPPDRTSAALLDAVRSATPPTMFHDELRSPIRSDDLGERLWALLALPRARRSGPWHLPGPEVLSRHELAVRVVRAAGLDPAAVGTASVRDHPTPRPRDLTLVSSRPALVDHPPRPVP